jgi:Leucine-rich repeat (LRR) protein
LQKLNTIIKKSIFVLISIFFFENGKAQLLDSVAIYHLDETTSLDSVKKNPDKVVRLNLKKHHLKEFPIEILKCKNLQYLDISRNTIKDIPEGIGQLTNLQYFLCSKTGLEHLPKDIGDLVNLKYINLNQNELESLPPQFGKLTKLEIADLWSNELEDFPETLRDLKKLKVLDLRNILMSDEKQRYLRELMPKTRVELSPSCKCAW